MSMNYTNFNNEIISKLSKCHDDIKTHPFRVGFEKKYIGDYKYLLYNLTEIWCDLIWRCEELPDFEKHRLRMFGEWIHNYRQYLRTWDNSTFPMCYFDYYEQMLQVTHDFVNTGNYSVYYDLDCYFGDNGKQVKSTRYEWITEEDCGIKSDILPRYLPVGATFITDECKAREYFSTGCFCRDSQKEKDANFDYWLKNTKPVLEWLNKRRKSIDAILPIWQSMRIRPSNCKQEKGNNR